MNRLEKIVGLILILLTLSLMCFGQYPIHWENCQIKDMNKKNTFKAELFTILKKGSKVDKDIRTDNHLKPLSSGLVYVSIKNGKGLICYYGEKWNINYVEPLKSNTSSFVSGYIYHFKGGKIINRGNTWEFPIEDKIHIVTNVQID